MRSKFWTKEPRNNRTLAENLRLVISAFYQLFLLQNRMTMSDSVSFPMMDGHQGVMVYLILSDAPGFVEFAKTVFEATERMRIPREDGKIMHAELSIAGSTLMLADATEEYSVQTTGYSFVYVRDVDEGYRKAMAAGATSIREPFDETYGARSAGIEDPFGNTWWMASLNK